MSSVTYLRQTRSMNMHALESWNFNTAVNTGTRIQRDWAGRKTELHVSDYTGTRIQRDWAGRKTALHVSDYTTYLPHTHTHTHTHTQLALLYTVTRNTTRIHYNINSTVQHIHQSVFICLLSHALRNFTLQPTRANRGTSASTAHSISAGGPG